MNRQIVTRQIVVLLIIACWGLGISALTVDRGTVLAGVAMPFGAAAALLGIAGAVWTWFAMR